MKGIFILLLLTISSTVSATKYYVSTSGNNSNAGTDSLHAWQTLAYAEALATTAGDIICLKKGDTWLLDNVLDINSGGISGSPIIWDGALWGSGANAIIQANSDGGAIPKYFALVHIAACSYITMENITFNVANKNRWGVSIGGSHNVLGPTLQNNESYITIQDCEVLDCGTGTFYCHGILVQTWNTNMSNITIQRNTINGAGAEAIAFYPGRSDLGAKPSEISNSYVGYNTITNMGRSGSLGNGVFINNKITGIIVEHNTITLGANGSGLGIGIDSNEPNLGYYPTNVIIRYNDVRMTEPCIYIMRGQAKTANVYYNKLYSTGSTFSAVIIITASASPNYSGALFNFYNNTIVTGGGPTTTGFNDNTNLAGICTFKNNIVMNTGASGYGCVKLGIQGSTVHSNNVYYQSGVGDLLFINDGSNYIYKSGVSAWEPTAKVGDPLLADKAGFNWHLEAGSPAIKAGNTIPGITRDIDGVTLSNPPNIGCFETPAGLVEPVYSNSLVEDATPTILEMIYNLNLDNNFIPPASVFNVRVNSVTVAVSSVTFFGNRVRLTLVSAVKAGDIITVAYTKPVTNTIRSNAGLEAASFTAQQVTNKCIVVGAVNTPPVLVVNYETSSYSGFVSEIDASGSYDADNDDLIFEWTAPGNVSVSSTSGSKIQFLAPIVENAGKINFFLKVSDGKAIRTQTIPINILPYKPGLSVAKIKNIEASSYVEPNNPDNIADGKLETKWSANGDNQWLVCELEKPFKVSHLEIAFVIGQRRLSYFDIYASNDNLSWEPVLINAASCSFSGDLQVFDFPEAKAEAEYSYIKLVGHGSSEDFANSYSELKIFGNPHNDEVQMTIYPNPAKDYINISIAYPNIETIEDPILPSRSIRIYNISGVLVSENVSETGNNNFQIPINLKSGIYIVHLISKGLTISAQKLIVIN